MFELQILKQKKKTFLRQAICDDYLNKMYICSLTTDNFLKMLYKIAKRVGT